MRNRFDHIWRVVATGFAFAALFGGGALIAMTAFPLVNLFTRSPKLRRSHNQLLIHQLFRFYIGMLRRLHLIDLSIDGASRLAAPGGRMVIANHPSLLDVVLIMSLTKRTQCIVKKELWENRYLGGLVRGAGYIRNDLEPEALIDACKASLQEGECLIIFPEGTRTTPGQPVKFRRGFANIAMHLDMTIQLVTIACDPPTLVKGEKWWTVPPYRPHFQLQVGDSIPAEDWTSDERRSLATRRFVRRLEDYYMKRLASPLPLARNA